jgi:hypothetical protein
MGSTLYVCYKENGGTSSPFPSRDLDCLASLPTTMDHSSSTFTILAYKLNFFSSFFFQNFEILLLLLLLLLFLF